MKKISRQQTLDFAWQAVFDDGNVINQFNTDGSENLFKDVEDYPEKLIEFSLISKNEDEQYIVDLVKKVIYGPGLYKQVSGTNPKLIYRRRNDVRVAVGTGILMPPRVTHILGIKTSTNTIQVEVFYGLEMKPSKIDLYDVKKKIKTDMTATIKARVANILAEKEKYSTTESFKDKLKEMVINKQVEEVSTK